MSTRTSTSTGLWSTFYISSNFAFFSLWKRNPQIFINLVQTHTAHCPCKFPLSIYICSTILCNLVQWHFNLHIVTYRLSWLTITTYCQLKNRKQKLYSIMKYVENSIFSCDQAALWMVFSVCLSVCLSVRLSVTPFWLCSHHRIIMKFSGVITTDQGNVHAKGQGQRSKVKFTEVTTQLDRFRTLTPVWIHIWWWNDAYSLMLLRRGALLFFKVIRQISRSHGSKNRRIWPRLGVSGL